MKKIKALAIFNALSLIAHIVMVYFVQEKWLNTKSVSEVSGRYETLFTPAGITFAIWGIIYTALGILCLYHIVIAYKHDKNHSSNIDLLRMGLFFILTNLASAAWLLAWTNERLLVSLLLIIVQLLSLAAIHTRLRLYDRERPAASKTSTQFPLSIYLAWICIATIANAAAYLLAIGWDGWGLSASQWTLVMITVAVALSLFMIFARHNIYFGFVVAWALYGIILKIRTYHSDWYDMIITIAWLGLGLILLSCLVQLINNMRHKPPPEPFPSADRPIK